MVFRKFCGMIMSVSMFTIGIGAATPRRVVNFSMGSLVRPRNKRAFAGAVKAGESRYFDYPSAELPADIGRHGQAAAQIAEALDAAHDGPDRPEQQDQPADEDEDRDDADDGHDQAAPEGRDLEGVVRALERRGAVAVDEGQHQPDQRGGMDDEAQQVEQVDELRDVGEDVARY